MCFWGNPARPCQFRCMPHSFLRAISRIFLVQKKFVSAMEPRWRRGVLGLGSFPRGHAMSQLGIDLSEILTGILPALSLQPDVGDTARLTQFLNALPAAIYMTDADGRITYFNEAAATLWGCRPKLNIDLWGGSWGLFWAAGGPLLH